MVKCRTMGESSFGISRRPALAAFLVFAATIVVPYALSVLIPVVVVLYYGNRVVRRVMHRT